MKDLVEESARNVLVVGSCAVLGATAAALAADVVPAGWNPATSALTPGAALLGACLAQRRHRGHRLDPTRARFARIAVELTLAITAAAVAVAPTSAASLGLWVMTLATVTVSVLSVDTGGEIHHAGFPRNVSGSDDARLSA